MGPFIPWESAPPLSKQMGLGAQAPSCEARFRVTVRSTLSRDRAKHAFA
jgi:hypothetical protein